jgi:hypothetical protein
MRTATRPAPAEWPDACPGCRRLAVRVAEIEQRLAPGPRDAADEVLVMAIADAVLGLPFTAAALWTRRRHVPELAQALEDADLTSVRELGAWLRRMQGATVGDWRLVAGAKGRDGILWRLARLAESQPDLP